MDGNAQSGSEAKHQWRLRDGIAAAFLFAFSADCAWFQNGQVGVLWDLGYLLDTAWRIVLGQMPYRDFPLAHAPLTFLMQSALIRHYGRHYEFVITYAMLATGAATVLGWRILLRCLAGVRLGWWIALLLATPLIVLGVYAIYPHPIYDSDCVISILLALVLLLRIEDAEGWITPVLAGAASVVPVFFKQNIGLLFLGAAAVSLAVLYAKEIWQSRTFLKEPFSSRYALALSGIVGAGCIALLLLTLTVGLNNYLHWTVQFAAQRRMPGLASMLSVYVQPDMAWAVGAIAIGIALCAMKIIERWWGKALAFLLMASPFAFTLIEFFLQEDADDRADCLLASWPLLMLLAFAVALLNLRRGLTLRNLVPFIVLAAIHGTLMSQQLWGSTYALWPLLFILIGGMLAALPRSANAIVFPLGIVCCVTFAACGSVYALSDERLHYIDLPEKDGKFSRTDALSGLRTPGPYIRNLDELVAFTKKEIPWNDALLVLPGEDPFYYATGRTPQFPVTLFDPATDPYSAPQLMEEAKRRNVRWVIVKRALQIRENPMPDREETMRLIAQQYTLYRALSGYDIYRAK